MVEVHLWPEMKATVLSMSSMSPWRQFLPSTAEMEAMSGLSLVSDGRARGWSNDGGRGGRTSSTKGVGLRGEEDKQDAQDE